MYDSTTTAIEDETLVQYQIDVNNNKNKNNGNGRKTTAAASSSNSTTGLIINRILIILLLAGLCAVTITLQQLQGQMRQALSTDEEKISTLETTVVEQTRVINRFNESITNSDVLDEIQHWQGTWDQERVNITNRVAQTKAYVDRALNSTMEELDTTVADASNEIQEQVNIVKKNFDQYVIHTKNEFSVHSNFMILQVCGTFCVLSCLISMWHMSSHTRKMKQPAIQRKILAILWLCPIYAVTSWLSLVLANYSGYFGIIKDSYEAYVIYQFLSFCISVIGGGDRNKVINLLAKQADHLSPPTRLVFCCGKPYYKDDRALANAVLTQCQMFTMQFIFWKPAVSISNVVLNHYAITDPSSTSTDWDSVQFWIYKLPVIIQNISIFVAFTGLLKFYHIVEKELEWCRPFAKFLCIKGVVFMTFWQGMALQILAETTNLGDGVDSPVDWSEGIQNILICLEMLLFSIAHFYCFPVEEWQPGYEANFRKAKFGETLALNDFFTDLRIVMTAQSNSKKKKKKKASTTTASITPTEATILEEEFECETDPGSMRNSFEEEPNEAIVRALMGSVRSDENDCDEKDFQTPLSTTAQLTVQEAQARRRLSSMLDDMLFFPRGVDSCNTTCVGKSSNSSNSSSSSSKSVESEDHDDADDDGSEKMNTTTCSDEAVIYTVDEESVDNERASANSLGKQLKPSIFTTISEYQSG